MRGPHAPTDPAAAFAAELADLRRRLADMERAAQRPAPAPARAMATKNSTQAISHAAALAAITFPDAESYDTDAFHSTTTNSSRLTVPAGLGGLYRCGFSLFYASHANNGKLQAHMSVNAGADRYGWTGQSSIAGDDGILTGSADVVLADGDYLEVFAFQTNGAGTDRTVGIVGIPSRFWLTYVGPVTSEGSGVGTYDPWSSWSEW
jgi:hypothetical protein